MEESNNTSTSVTNDTLESNPHSSSSSSSSNSPLLNQNETDGFDDSASHKMKIDELTADADHSMEVDSQGDNSSAYSANATSTTNTAANNNIKPASSNRHFTYLNI